VSDKLILLQALQDIRDKKGLCIYARDSGFREGSNAAYEECAEIASKAINAFIDGVFPEATHDTAS
jgi:hypothetical protein